AFSGPGVTHVVHVKGETLVSTPVSEGGSTPAIDVATTPAVDAVTTAAFGAIPVIHCPADGPAAEALAVGGDVGRLGRLAAAEWQALVAAAQVGVMDAALRLGIAH